MMAAALQRHELGRRHAAGSSSMRPRRRPPERRTVWTDLAANYGRPPLRTSPGADISAIDRLAVMMSCGSDRRAFATWRNSRSSRTSKVAGWRGQAHRAFARSPYRTAVGDFCTTRVAGRLLRATPRAGRGLLSTARLPHRSAAGLSGGAGCGSRRCPGCRISARRPAPGDLYRSSPPISSAMIIGRLVRDPCPISGGER
jgi:hypothetical protein